MDLNDTKTLLILCGIGLILCAPELLGIVAPLALIVGALLVLGWLVVTGGKTVIDTVNSTLDRQDAEDAARRDDEEARQRDEKVRAELARAQLDHHHRQQVRARLLLKLTLRCEELGARLERFEALIDDQLGDDVPPELFLERARGIEEALIPQQQTSSVPSLLKRHEEYARKIKEVSESSIPDAEKEYLISQMEIERDS